MKNGKIFLTVAVIGSLLLAIPSAMATTVGPDAAGYIAMDENEPAGPTYSFFDIAAPANLVADITDCDDCLSSAIPLGFEFEFYNVPYTSVFVHTNGFINLDGTAPADGAAVFLPSALPSIDAPGNIIAAVWSDWDPSEAGDIYAKTVTLTDGSKALIVQWDVVPHYPWTASTAPASTFQVWLLENDSIVLMMKDVNCYGTHDGDKMSIGIQNGDASVGLSYFFGCADYDTFAVAFYPGPTPLAPVPELGTIVLSGLGALFVAVGLVRRHRRS